MVYPPRPVRPSCQCQSSQQKKGEGNSAKAIARSTKEDPHLQSFWFDNDSKETIASGMGSCSGDLCQRMEREYNWSSYHGHKPTVAFREQLVKTCNFDSSFEQSGGRGEYALSHRLLGATEPHENTRLEFIDATTGTNVPKPFVSVKKGYMDSCMKGQTAGQEVTGRGWCSRMAPIIRWTPRSGPLSGPPSPHSMTCARTGVADPEPVMSVEVNSPQEFTSEVSELSINRTGMLLGRLGVRTGSLLRPGPLNKCLASQS